jgi:hypothetical protein
MANRTYNVFLPNQSPTSQVKKLVPQISAALVVRKCFQCRSRSRVGVGLIADHPDASHQMDWWLLRTPKSSFRKNIMRIHLQNHSKQPHS